MVPETWMRTPKNVLAVAVALSLAVACLVTFRSLLGSRFTEFDDPVYVTKNEVVKEGLTAHGIAWAFTDGWTFGGHPLTWLSHMLDVRLFGLDPRGHHLTSLLLHAANAVLLFFILRGMTGALWPSAFTAALFAAHPLHVESVAWVAERKDVLSTFFWMLTMGAWLAYVRRPRRGRYLAVFLCLALGLMAKAMLVTLPLVLLLLDWWPLGRIAPAGAPGGRPKGRAPGWLLVEKAPLLALSVASSVVTSIATYRGGAVTGMESLSLGPRLSNSLLAYRWYLGKTFWPSRLAVIYPFDASAVFAAGRVLGALAVLLAVSLAAILLTRRRPFLFTGWFWFLGTLVPVIGLVQVGGQAFADRYTYVPLVGIFLAAAWGIAALPGRWRHRPAALAVPAIIVLALLMRQTRIQAGYWKDNLTLFNHALEVSPRSWQAHQMVAISLIKQGEGKEGIRHLEEVLKIVPAMSEAHTNLGKALADLGRPAEAVTEYEAALRIKPEDALTRALLAGLLLRQGKPKEAAAQYREVLRSDPGNAEAEHNLGSALDDLGQAAEAVEHFQAALRLKPDLIQAHINLGVALARLGRLDEAQLSLGRALSLDPGNETARADLREVLAMKGR